MTPAARLLNFLALTLALFGNAAAETASDGIDDFLSQHWQRPLAAQGPSPARFSPLEASIAAKDCGQCHRQQFNDWQSARHSMAMGPGLLGQLQAMGADAGDDHQACLICHAPLAEQATALQQALRRGRASIGRHADGLSCAACHVRHNRRFGPSRRDGSGPVPGEALPHDGWQVSAAYADARFCAACHQFPADWPALNGKPLENTYAEWQASRYARENRPCQSCHMPDRRHLWRGIHDRATTRRGLDIEFAPLSPTGKRLTAQLSIASTGIGHAFPTYVTPLVRVDIFQADAAGHILAGTREQHLIGRLVSPDLERELLDSRLLPDETRRYTYRQARRTGAVALVARIEVAPDAYYADFYRALLADPAYRKGYAALRSALRLAETSPYTLYRASLAIESAGLAGSAAVDRDLDAKIE